MWVRFQSSQCWSSQILDISYAVDWAMLYCTRYPCIDMFDIMCGSESPISVVFIVDYESRNAAMIWSVSTSSIALRDSSGVKVDTNLLIFWCLWKCTIDMPWSIDWYTSDRLEIRSTYFHIDFTVSGCIFACLRVLMLSYMLTKRMVLPNMDSIILIAHTTPSWPPSSPQ